MINDIYTAGIASGWSVTDASTYTSDTTLEADVVIVGSGAGGGTAAEILAQAGFKVLIIEEGPLKTSDSFRHMDEAQAYKDLYQEAGGRATSDGAIAVLQGRSVGGSTTVNWTSSFRTPEQTLNHWADKHGVVGSSSEDMAPWFTQMEQRLGVNPWRQAPNPNNSVLARGAEKLGWEAHGIPRNVVGCWDSGYCGYGCPVNAKQSMLVSTIPAALKLGASLVHRLSVQRIEHNNGKVSGLTAVALAENGVQPTGVTAKIKATHYVLAGGAINTPALLLRSEAPNPHQQTGKHTCIHPVNLTMAEMPEEIHGYYGAPQSIASNEFLWPDASENFPGYKIEVPPIYPALSAAVLSAHGQQLADSVGALPHSNAMLALVRDGFDEGSQGGQVRVDSNGFPLLDYDLTDYLRRGFKHAYLRMAEIQFAAGAKRVMPSHLDGQWASTWREAQQHIENLSYEKFRMSLFTAHLMGGAAMGEDPKQSVVNSYGRHHQLENLSVLDGSVFPTSLGVNPQLSVYGFTAKNATKLAQDLGAKVS